MTDIVKTSALIANKNYAFQARAILPGGQTTEWGPTFSLQKRNLIANRDSITLDATPDGAVNKEPDGSTTITGNITADQYWKYGYAGWGSAHATETKTFNTATTAGRLTIEAVDETPDAIRLGFANGSGSAMTFGTQSRYYPSVYTSKTSPTAYDLSRALMDDPIAIIDSDENGKANKFSDLYGSTKAAVWIENSASDIFNDTLNTMLPIELDESMTINGSFDIAIESWGSGTDDPPATLKLYAIYGTWDSDTPEGIYDPHYCPPTDYSYNRTVEGAWRVTNRAKSGRTVTLTLLPGLSSYPEPGDSITVIAPNQYTLGTGIVASRTDNTITYRMYNSTNVTTIATNSVVFVNAANTYTPTHREKTGTLCSLYFATSAPGVGEFISVDINQTEFDSKNNASGDTADTSAFKVLSSDWTGTDYKITYNHDVTIGAPLAKTTASGYVVVNQMGPVAEMEEVASWIISRSEETGLYSQALSQFTTANYSWQWQAPSGTAAENIRFAWVLEYGVTDFTSYLSVGKSFYIKLKNFEAYFGKLDEEAASNNFRDQQYFDGGAVFGGETFFQDNVWIESTANLNVDGESFFTGILNADIANITNSLTINNEPVISTGDIKVYSTDYPMTDANGAFGGSDNEVVFNSIMSADNPIYDSSKYPYYLSIVSWSGLLNAVNTDQWYFRLYRFADEDNSWNHMRTVSSSGTGAAADSQISGAMVHFALFSTSAIPSPAFVITAERVSDTPSTTVSTGYTGASPPSQGNRLQFVTIPLTTKSRPTVKPTLTNAPAGMVTTYTTTYSGGDPGEDPGDTSTVAKTATYAYTGGWKESYKGDGSVNAYTSGELVQGYYSSTNGNQKSAWGFGINNWAKDSGDTINTAKVVNDSIEIVSCKVTVKTTHWYSSSGGTLVLGTHSEIGPNGAPNDWSKISGKTADRQRIGYSSPTTKTFDLNLGMAKEIWNGHLRYYLPGGSPGTNQLTGAGYDFNNYSGSKGFIFGPGPSTSEQFYGKIDKSTLKVKMKVKWKETR